MINYTRKEWKEELTNLKLCPIYGYIEGDYKTIIFTIENNTVGIIKYYSGCFMPYLHFIPYNIYMKWFNQLSIADMNIINYIRK